MPRIDSIVLCCGILTLFLALFLTGCSAKPTNIIRITEYAAESPLTQSATVGGCSVESSTESVTGILSLKYAGEKCSLEYYIPDE